MLNVHLHMFLEGQRIYVGVKKPSNYKPTLLVFLFTKYEAFFKAGDSVIGVIEKSEFQHSTKSKLKMYIIYI